MTTENISRHCQVTPWGAGAKSLLGLDHWLRAQMGSANSEWVHQSRTWEINVDWSSGRRLRVRGLNFIGSGQEGRHPKWEDSHEHGQMGERKSDMYYFSDNNINNNNSYSLTLCQALPMMGIMYLIFPRVPWDTSYLSQLGRKGDWTSQGLNYMQGLTGSMWWL